MNTRRFIPAAAVVAGLGIVVAAGHLRDAQVRGQHVMQLASSTVGRQLIRTTNSQLLVEMTPGFRADLEQVLARPTRCQVSLGDDSPPLGDGRARTRLRLENQAGQTLTVRLLNVHDAGNRLKFQILSYRLSGPPNAALGSQPSGADANAVALPPGFSR